MDVSCQLSPVDFSSESSTLHPLGIELTLFVTVSNQRLYPQGHVAKWICRSVQQPKRCDKHSDIDEDNSPKNVNNIHNNSSKKYRQKTSG